jgi:hypothetical protein
MSKKADLFIIFSLLGPEKEHTGKDVVFTEC